MFAQHNPIDPDNVDTFVADPDAALELGVSLVTMWRYDHSAELVDAGWPPKIQIRKRNYRSRHQLEQFKRTMLKKAIADRNRSADICKRLQRT
jgi:hypothetical protein